MKTSNRPCNLFQLSGFILFVCGLLCTGGCTTPPGGSIEVKQSPAQSLSGYKIVAVEVTNKDLDFDTNEVDQLTSSILGGLRKSGRFDKVYAYSQSDEHDADLKLSVLVEFVVGLNMKNNVQSIETSVALTDSVATIVTSASVMYIHLSLFEFDIGSAILF